MTSTTITVEQRAMVEKNLPLVEHIVSRLAARFASNYSREDLVQTGTIGLIEATCRFDPERGVAFSTFAGRRIEGSIIDMLRRDDWAPRSVRELERQVEQLDAGYRAKGASAKAGEIEESLGLNKGQLSRLRADLTKARVDSLDRMVGGDDSTVSLVETLADFMGSPVENDLDDREVLGYLRDAVRSLPERHRLVIMGYFFEGKSMTELGGLLGVTQSRASQIKEDAIRMMRSGVLAQYRNEDDDAVEDEKLCRRQRVFNEALASANDWRSRIA